MILSVYGQLQTCICVGNTNPDYFIADIRKISLQKNYRHVNPFGELDIILQCKSTDAVPQLCTLFDIVST